MILLDRRQRRWREILLTAVVALAASSEALLQYTVSINGNGILSRSYAVRLAAVWSSSISPESNSSSQSNDYNAAEVYVRHWDHLLQEEHHAAVVELRDQRSRWSRQRLEASGVTLFDASAEPDSELFGEKLVRIYQPGSTGGSSSTRSWRDIYARGDVLVMTPTASSVSGSRRPGFPSSRPRRRQKGSSSNHKTQIMPREICVSEVGPDWMTASVGPSWPAGLWESRKHAGQFQVRLDRTVPQSTLLAQKKALDWVRRNRAGRAARLLVDSFDHATTTSSSRRNVGQSSCDAKSTAANADAATTTADDAASQVPPYLRYLLEETTSQQSSPSSSSSPSLLDSAIAQAIHRAKKQSSFRPNASQEEAIAWALRRSMSLIRGPPGTGKTVCAALLISSAMRLQAVAVVPPLHATNNTHHPDTTTTTPTTPTAPLAPPRILAVAHSNGAADVLLQALLDMGVPAIRVGRPASVAAALRHRTVVAMAEKHPDVKRLRAKVVDMTLDSAARGTAASEVVRCLHDVRHMLATTAPVVVASCIGAHQLLLSGADTTSGGADGYDASPAFPMVVLDEAAQSTEPALLCALVAARAEQIVFVGDTRQLPPTVASDTKELRDSLGISPMARLESSRVGQQTLRVQYRMAPALLQFPSTYFYDGLVTCADSILQSAAAASSESAAAPPAGFPWPNKSQPLAFLELGSNLETTHDLGGKSNPTEADLVVKVVSNLVAGKEVAGRGIAVISPYAKQVQLIRTLLSSRNIKDVRVGTVDSFQGQETEVVVFSGVRSNIMNEIGFLRDPRRLCVALTRAKRGLIIIGDPLVLQTSRHWNALLESCRERGCMLNKSEFEFDGTPEMNKEEEEASQDSSSDAALFAALEASLEDEDGLQDLFDEVPV